MNEKNTEKDNHDHYQDNSDESVLKWTIKHILKNADFRGWQDTNRIKMVIKKLDDALSNKE